MATNIISMNDVDTLFAQFVQNLTGLPENKVLISYSTSGQISSSIDENVAYVHSSYKANEINKFKQRREEYKENINKITITQYAMRVLNVQVIFYGPNSEQLSQLVYESLFMEEAKEFLYKNNLSLIPDLTEIGPINHEKINERWWSRSDLNIGLYGSISIDSDVYTIEKLDTSIKTDVEVNR